MVVIDSGAKSATKMVQELSAAPSAGVPPPLLWSCDTDREGQDWGSDTEVGG